MENRREIRFIIISIKLSEQSFPCNYYRNVWSAAAPLQHILLGTTHSHHNSRHFLNHMDKELEVPGGSENDCGGNLLLHHAFRKVPTSLRRNMSWIIRAASVQFTSSWSETMRAISLRRWWCMIISLRLS